MCCLQARDPVHKLGVQRTANAIRHADPIGYYDPTEIMIPSVRERPMFDNGEAIVYTVMRPCRQCPRVKQERATEEIKRLGGGVAFIENCCSMGKGDNGGCTATGRPNHNNLCSGGGGGAGAGSSGTKRKNPFEPDFQTENKELKAENKELKAQLAAAKTIPLPVFYRKDVLELEAAVCC